MAADMDQDEETAIQAPNGTGPKITWSGPPLMPRFGGSEPLPHRLREAGHASDARHLLALGATPLDTSQACRGAITLTVSTATSSAWSSGCARGGTSG